MTNEQACAMAYGGHPPPSILERARTIQWLVLDADGVLTDGTLTTGPSGEDLKAFHVHDGKGLVMLRQRGVGLAIVTARRSQALAGRAAELGITELRQDVRDKAAAMASLAQDHGIDEADMAYVGDDIIDLGACQCAGLAVAVADAHPLLAARSHWVTQHPGGRGAVREVSELILAARGELARVFAEHE